VRSSQTPVRQFVNAALIPNIAGLITAQCLASLHVLLSNLRLFEKISAISAAGYLGVPNLLTMPLLKSFDAVFNGGIFFTLSLGAGLSLLSFAAAWFWVYGFNRRKSALLFYCLLLLALLFMINHRGFVLFPSLYFIIVPPIVFSMTAKRNRQKTFTHRLWMRLFPVYPLILLTLLWSTQMDSRLFINIRDYILMSNPVGIKINDFYYRYTLYPAEVFKSLSQKLLRSCDLSEIANTPVHRRVARQLRNHDYLAVSGLDAPDLMLRAENDRLIFMHAGRKVLETDGPIFLSKPKPLLDQFSAETDRLTFFRSATFYGILVAFPVLLYFIFYSLLRLIFSTVLQSPAASVLAAGLCFMLGIGLLIPVYLTGIIRVDSGNLHQTITSERWQDQVAGLQYIEKNRIDIADAHAYATMVSSPHLPVRYWAARAMAESRQPETYPYLFALIRDPHVNVVCQALYGLGKRGRRHAVPEIISLIKTSHSWYIQRYGYNALRMLGWRQPELK